MLQAFTSSQCIRRPLQGSGALLIALSIGFTAHAQNIADTNPQTGLLPSNTYSIDRLETIDRVNGNVMYHIPLASLPKVGPDDPFQLQLVYNSQSLSASYKYIDDPNTPNGYILQAYSLGLSGWTYNTNYQLQQRIRPTPDGTVSCTDPNAAKQYAMWFVTPDGARHALDLYGYSDYDGYYSVDAERSVNLSCNGGSTPISGPLTYFTSDGTYIKVIVTLPSSQYGMNWTAYYPNGGTVTQTWTDASHRKTTITDRNGNVITDIVSYPGNGTVVQTISNAAGSIQILNSGQTDTITTAAFGGTQQLTWTVHYQFFSFFGGVTGSTGYYTCDSLEDQCQSGLQASLITSIDLPSPTGVPLSFQFGYNTSGGWGNLNSVRYPSGATVHYEYRDDGSTINANSSFFLTNPVTRKEIDYNDIQDGTTTPRSEVWTFQYEVNNTSCNNMIGPNNGTDQVCFTQLDPTGEALTGTIYKHVSPMGQMDEKQFSFNRPAWDGTVAPNPYVSMEVRTVPGQTSMASVTTHTVDANGNDVQTNTYDYVPYSQIQHGPTGQVTGAPSGTLLRSVTSTYFSPVPTASNGQSTPDNANGYWYPTSPKLLHLLARSTVTGSGTGSATEYTYDGAANITEKRRWDSNKSPSMPSSLNSGNSVVDDYTYDGRGNLTLHTDPRQIPTKYDYDANGIFLQDEILAYQTPVSETIQFSEDPSTGLMTSRTDANGVSITYSYDLLGRLTEIRAAAGTSTERDTLIKYEDGNLREVVCADQNHTGDLALVNVTDYDPLGRVRLTRQMETPSCSNPDDDTAGIKVQTRYAYVNGGQLKLVSNPFAAATSAAASSESTMGWTLTTSDDDGRVVSVQNFDGSGLPAPWGGNGNSSGSVSTSYNAQYTTVTDQANHARTMTSDGLGRLVQIVEDPGGLNYTTAYTYDALGDLTGVNQSGQTRTFTYDSLQQLVGAVNPESGTLTYTYDADGNLASRKDSRTTPITTTYTYDALNRIETKTYQPAGSAPDVTYTYDAGPNGRGRLSSVSNGNATTNFLQYDALGNVLASSQTTGQQTYGFAYTYNVSGALTSEAYPSGRTVTMTYDGANRVNAVTGSLNGQQTSYVSGVNYAPQGTPSLYLYGNPGTGSKQLARTINYNSRLQWASADDEINQDPGYNLLHQVYIWSTNGTDDNGNLRSSQFWNGGGPGTNWIQFNQTYTYDGVNRLKTATDTGWSRAYCYDAYGNMWVTGYSVVVPAGNTPQEIGGPCPSGTTPYLGNNRINGASYDSVGNQTVVNDDTLTYNSENRVTSAYDPVTHNTEDYLYDGDGRRVEKSIVGGTSTTYVYDAFGNLTAEYGAMQGNPPCTTCYLSYDWLGTVRMVTDASGTVKARHDFLPFGQEIQGGIAGRNGPWGSTSDVEQKFTGKIRDQETGLDYFGARYYGNALGRFTSPDAPFEDQHPEDPQSWNLYSYVRNNPLKNTDPTGEDCTDGVGACVDYIIGGLKALGNVPTSIVNAPDHIANALISPFTDYRFQDALPTPFAPTNVDQQQGFEAANAVMLVTPVAEAGPAKATEVLGATTNVEAVSETATATREIPTSIPAGPSPRPTPAQQKAINEMGDAHGCSTCGTTTPGTQSGNWVGDHQPPTALNTSGGPQVYKPQCLQCSRQQGGQVAAATRAAKKAACSTANQNCQ